MKRADPSAMLKRVHTLVEAMRRAGAAPTATDVADAARALVLCGDAAERLQRLLPDVAGQRGRLEIRTRLRQPEPSVGEGRSVLQLAGHHVGRNAVEGPPDERGRTRCRRHAGMLRRGEPGALGF